MPRKPQPPMDESELTSMQTEKRNSQFYRTQSGKHRQKELSALVGRVQSELRDAPERIALVSGDLAAVKAQVYRYIDSCIKAGTMPSVQGTARSLGHTRQSLYKFLETHSNSEIALFLEMARDACSEALDTAALANDINPIVSIFIQKSLFGRREGLELIPVQPDKLLATSGNIDAAREYADRLRLLDGGDD